MKIYLGPAVVDGELKFVSVTQVEKWLACNRQWGFRYVERLPEPKTPAQDAGIAFHDRLDRYYKTGEAVLTRVELAGKHLLYTPGPGVASEVESLGDLRLGGVPLYLKVDLLNGRDYYLDEEGERRPLDSVHGVREVCDWKTTNDVEKKAKTPRGLLETVQMVTYGAWALRGGAPVVRLSHTYFGTRRREAKKVTVLATAYEVDSRLSDIEAAVRDGMVPGARATRAADLEPNWDSCERCAYRSVCPRPTQQVLIDIFGPGAAAALAQQGGQDMDFDPTAFLSQISAPAGAPAPSPAPAPAPTAPDPAVAAEVARLQAELEAKKAQLANVMLTGQQAQQYAAATGAGPIPQGAGIQTSHARAAEAGVLSDDSPPSGATGPIAKPIPPESLATMPEPIRAAHTAVFPPADPLAGVIAAAPSPAMPPAAAPTTAPADEPEAKRGRGRPRKPKSDPAEPAETGDAVASSPAPAPAATAVGIALYVDCVVAGIATMPLELYVDRACAALCAQFKAQDVRCGPEDSPLGFGRWKGALAGYVRAFPPLAGAYTLLTEGSEVRQVVAEALRPLCATYTRGVR